MPDRSKYETILAADIPAKLVADISRAQHKVHLQAMNLQSSKQMRPVINAIRDARKRNVHVTLAFDRFTFLHMSRREARLLKKDCSDLHNEGVTIKLLGKSLWPLPVAGRSHTKLYVIDDTAYFGGGVNLYNKGFAAHDFMLRNQGNVPLLNALDKVIVRQPNDPHDWSIIVSDGDKILVDGGRRNHSLIFDEAVKLATVGKKLWYVSQFSPGRKLEKQLSRLPRDDLKTWFNIPSSSSFGDKWSALIDNMITRLENRYKGTRRIHAKFLVVQKADGSYAAITGSHNFSDWGIRFGTKEAALCTTDQDVCQQLVEFAESLDA